MKALVEDLMPIIIFLVLSILGYLLYLLCYVADCCCNICCPNKKCCKKDPTEKYTKYEIYWPVSK